jgi:hypothetical protein
MRAGGGGIWSVVLHRSARHEWIRFDRIHLSTDVTSRTPREASEES